VGMRVGMRHLGVETLRMVGSLPAKYEYTEMKWNGRGV